MQQHVSTTIAPLNVGCLHVEWTASYSVDGGFAKDLRNPETPLLKYVGFAFWI